MSTRGANWTPLIGVDGALTGRGGGAGAGAPKILVAISDHGDSYTRERGISCVTMAVAERKPSLVERLFAEHRAALQGFFLRRIRSKADAADQRSGGDPQSRPLSLHGGQQSGEGACGARSAAGERHRHRRGSGARAARDAARIRRGARCDTAGRAARGGAQAAAPEMPRRGGAALHAWTLLPGDRDPPRGVAADGEKVRGAGAGSLSTPHGGARLNL